MTDPTPKLPPNETKTPYDLEDEADLKDGDGEGDESTSHEARLLRLEHYEIIRRIGQGGMGDVYLAKDGALERTVAIKVLPEEFSREPDFIRRFQAEATAAARLNHPNIVPIHAIGEENGRHFFVMQYVVGKSLADRLRVEIRLPLDETFAIVDQLVTGLAAAHRSGLVHRDIKPSNVLLDEEHDRVVLADFGLVKSVDAVGNDTATGVILGTVDYMSPEQGGGKHVDHRSDLYSVGVMLYRMLAGCLPFEGESPTAIIFQHVYETAPDLHSVASDISPKVSTLVAKLLAKEPRERYQSADELLLALRSLGRDLGLLDASQIISATAFGTDNQSEFGCKSRLSIRERIALLLKRRAPKLAEHLLNTQQQVDVAVNDYEERCLQLESLLADAQYVQKDLANEASVQRESAAKWRQRGETEASETKRQAAVKDQRICEEIAEDLERQAAAQQDEVETIQLQFVDAKAKLLKLSNQRDLLSARLRAAQAATDGSPSSQLLSPTKIVSASALAIILAAVCFLWFRSSDFGSAKNGVGEATGPKTNDVEQRDDTEMRVLGSDEFRLSEIEIGRVESLAMSPENINDGSLRFSIAGSNGAIRRFEVARNSPRVAKVVRDDLHLKKINDLTYSPDGRWLVSASNDGTVQVFDTRAERVIRTIPITARALRFSDDGERLWIASHDEIFHWNVQLDKEIHRIDLGPRYNGVVAMDWLRDGPIVLFGIFVHGGTSCGLWNVDQERPLLLMKEVKSPTTEVYIVGQGAYAVILSSQLAQLRSLTDGSLVAVYGPRRTNCMAMTADRRRLLTGDVNGQVEVWSLASGEIVERLKLHSEAVECIGVSHDGNWVVAVSELGRVAVRKLSMSGE